MKRLLVFMMLALWLGLAASAAAARRSHARGQRCQMPAHGHVLAPGTKAVVYEVPVGFLAMNEVFGCAYGHRQRYLFGQPLEGFGSPEGISGVSDETVGGSLAAYESGYAGPHGLKWESSWAIIVRDLRTGRVLRTIPTAPKGPQGGPSRGAVAIVVTSNGAVAWIAYAGPIMEAGSPVGSNYAIEISDRKGTREVGQGADINASSLALAGNTVYWTQAGKPFSEVLH